MDTAEEWKVYQRMSPASRQGCGKLGECLREDTGTGGGRGSQKSYVKERRNSVMGSVEVGWLERKADTVDPVIKIKQSALNRQANRHHLFLYCQRSIPGRPQGDVPHAYVR